MMKMRITEHWPQSTRFDGSIASAYDRTTSMGESGYTSIREMQKELMRRFPHDGPTQIAEGIRYTTLSYGRTMDVTLHD
jgi:hypothetical protein